MHNFFLIFMLTVVSYLQSSAQITLEHTYNFPVTRIRTQLGLDHYVREPYQAADNAWKVDVFDGNHNLVNTAVLPWTGNFFDIGLVEINDYFWDTDNGVEFIIERQTSGSLPLFSVHDDSGAQIGPDYNNKPTLVTLSTGERKLVAADDVFTVPGLVKEHTFEQGEQKVRYAWLEDAGDIFYTLNTSGQLVLYKPDYTLYTSINTGLNTASEVYIPRLIGQYLVNGDPAVEWSLQWVPGSLNIVQYYSGEALLSTDSFNVSIFSSDHETLLPGVWPGITGAKSVFRKTSSPTKIAITDVLTGTEEFAADGSWRFADTYSEGTKIWQSNRPGGTTSVSVLNPDYTQWATFPLAGDDYRVTFPSTLIFDNDPATKELVIEDSNVFPKFRIEDEAGNNLLVTPSCTTAIVSRLVNLPNKLLARGIYQTYVYSLPSSGPVSEANDRPAPPALQISAMPNPFNNVLHLDLTAINFSTVDISIFDNLGRSVLTQHGIPSGAAHAVQGSDRLRPGVYWVRVSADNSQYGWTKVVKH